MAKLTVSEIKKQIAALEAKAVRLAEEETTAAVGKVRALMNQLGVTLEHLSSAVARKGVAVKKAIRGGKPAAAKRAGKGVAKYRDPKTGATWSGFGRAPGWIAGAPSREAFLVAKSSGTEASVSAPPATKKRAAGKKAAAKKAVAKKALAKKAVKRAAAVVKKVVSKAAAPAIPKKKPSIKAAATKAAAKKAAKKTASAGSASALAAADGTGASAT